MRGEDASRIATVLEFEKKKFNTFEGIYKDTIFRTFSNQFKYIIKGWCDLDILKKIINFFPTILTLDAGIFSKGCPFFIQIIVYFKHTLTKTIVKRGY